MKKFLQLFTPKPHEPVGLKSLHLKDGMSENITHKKISQPTEHWRTPPDVEHSELYKSLKKLEAQLKKDEYWGE